jgi:hypothetical protein
VQLITRRNNQFGMQMTGRNFTAQICILVNLHLRSFCEILSCFISDLVNHKQCALVGFRLVQIFLPFFTLC